MSTVLPAVALLAGLACPAHMIWRMRRGEQTSCMPARRAERRLIDPRRDH